MKSDNCSEQFKSKYVFGFWENFSQRSNIPVLLFYGVPGHGKGLLDSMSYFGVNGPIRDAILREDFWYHNSQDFEGYLLLKFLEDETKKYYVLDPIELLKRNKEKMKFERERNGCKRMVMIAFIPDGKILVARNYCSCGHCLVGSFDSCSDDTCDGRMYNCTVSCES